MRRFVMVALMVVAGVFIAPATAWAHAELLVSEPGYGDRLVAAPADVRLEFSGPIDLTGARLTFQRNGSGTVESLRARLAGPDRRVVAVALPPDLPNGGYTLMWFFLGGDGHLMGGEIPFTVRRPDGAAEVPIVPPEPARGARGQVQPPMRTLGAGIAGPASRFDVAGPPTATANSPSFRIAVAAPRAMVRVLDYASLAVLIGGGFFLARVWAAGTAEGRGQRLLWGALAGTAVATILTFGLTAAGLRGVSALDALDPPVMGAVLGTRFSRVMATRALFLALGFVALVLLRIGGERAVRARWWQALAGGSGAGVLVTHALLGHASNEGFAARLAVFVHLLGMAVWLGGLVFLAAVVLPRRRAEEVRALLPHFSRLAFAAVTAMVLAGAVMVLRVAPALTELPQSGYGRLLLVKLSFVALLLGAAQRARILTERHLVTDATRLRPLVTALGVELVLAVVILSSTSVLTGRVPPGPRPPTNAVSTLKGQR